MALENVSAVLSQATNELGDSITGVYNVTVKTNNGTLSIPTGKKGYFEVSIDVTGTNEPVIKYCMRTDSANSIDIGPDAYTLGSVILDSAPDGDAHTATVYGATVKE